MPPLDDDEGEMENEIEYGNSDDGVYFRYPLMIKK